MLKVEDLIKKLQLQPHPEGGYFKETYRSEGEITLDNLNWNYSGPRIYSTCIYFLLTSENFSAFHWINQDEIWHFYMGSPMKIHTKNEQGNYIKHLIGIDLPNAEIPQVVVNGGEWFAAEVVEQNSYSLVGCTVAPGFSFDDFELAKKAKLVNQYPQHRELITKFTRQ